MSPREHCPTTRILSTALTRWSITAVPSPTAMLLQTGDDHHEEGLIWEYL